MSLELKMKLNAINIEGIKYKLENIVLIIGPNNAGKTKLLEDLNYELLHSYDRPMIGDHIYQSTDATLWPQMIDADDFSFEQNELDYWIDSHVAWKKNTENNQRMHQLMLRSKNHILQWMQGTNGVLYEDQLIPIKTQTLDPQQWMVKFKESHIDFARIDNRFSEASNIESIDFNNLDNPRLFYADTNNLREINKHVIKLFNKKFVVLQNTNTTYKLLLLEGNETDFPTWGRSNKFETMMQTISYHSRYVDSKPYALVSRQSHGTRAAIDLVMRITEPTRKILFIDEPEAHIYPAAKKYIGSLIADRSAKKQFILATHDVEMLERLANSRKNFSVLKVQRDRTIKVVDFNSARRRATSSELKNTKALRAGFYDSVVFVEGPSDRYIYEGILRRKKMINEGTEYGIIDCDGNDRIAHSMKFSKEIGNKIAVITDFDTIFASKKSGTFVIDQIIDSIGGGVNLKRQSQNIRELLHGVTDKKRGLSSKFIDDHQKEQVGKYLNAMKNHGIFIVPVGELYDWFSKTKAKFAVEDLRNSYFNNSKKYPDLTQFLSEVARFSTH